jgi:hypothetical protein
LKKSPGYWETSISQIPAQASDKANENFFRTTFFELCTRYLSQRFTFAIEANLPNGRSDWEMLGKRGSGFDRRKYVLEFKYFPNTEADKQKVLCITSPREEDVIRVKGFGADILARFPEYELVEAVVYIAGNKGFVFFKV